MNDHINIGLPMVISDLAMPLLSNEGDMPNRYEFDNAIEAKQ
jgi:hypothetical protein